MRQQRWFRITVLAVALFAVNVIARLVIRFSSEDGSGQGTASIAMFATIVVILAVLTFLRSQRLAPGDWLPEVGFGALGGMALTVLLGPLVSGHGPFANGAGDFFAQIWLYAACAGAGTAIGYWTAVMLGRDYRSRALKAFTEARKVRPRRVVGR
ncbi:hypothetical protein [Actinoplanes xinjiangensis]|jgi:hypothetical protein|uniref:Uncharacterized protein n=1 Tax=Actinoplanes xinjiangensis TaxID=512350 RepID=A0A316G869_9ACTN|nr:hypothetical protein [Actinoplanes xinjiangensis]PWK50667.1 hypothetical protein BC793_103555 [Actinoplanes xinjiangensis]GIF36557.1 hypothetical protein Axi01nite_08680 [Actinoplanes xinjiangensis]